MEMEKAGMKDFGSSIRSQLILFISVPLVVAALVIGTVSLLSTYQEISEVYDAQLVHSAKVLLQLTAHEAEEEGQQEIELDNEPPQIEHPYENNMTFRVWKGDGLMTQSHQAEEFGDFRAPEGFSNQTIAGEDWRFFVFTDKRLGLKVEIGERYEVREELIYKILAGLFVSLCLFIPVPLIIVWYGVARSLRPLIVLSKTVDGRDVNDFKPIETDAVPLEIHPLIKAFNRLLGRIEGSFERERQFTDNAAHELKTPLAAMKMQTQVLLKKSAGTSDCEEGLKNLHASIDRASRMVDQLLLFARLQADNIALSPVDFSEVAAEIAQDLAPVALQKKIDLEADLESNLGISGNRNALALMVRNLLDNAIKFTPQGGTIRLRALREGAHVVLQVADTGPGISDVEKQRVFERFYRTKKSETQGSGLGLSMVKWVCDLHGAAIDLRDNDPNGLLATVTF